MPSNPKIWVVIFVVWTNFGFSSGAEKLEFPKKEEDSFVFYLHVESRMTMSLMSEDKLSLDVIYYNPEQKKYSKKKRSMAVECSTTDTSEVTDSDIEEAEKEGRFLFGDGRHDLVLTINGTVPGPTLVVNQGADVTIILFNNLHTESLTLTSHGLNNTNNWFMNGVKGLQQCPVPAGSAFVYSLKADNPGTHFYHGHLATGATLYGPLIVIPKGTEGSENYKTPEDSSVKPTAEYVVSARDTFKSEICDVFYGNYWSHLKLLNPNLDTGNAGTNYNGPISAQQCYKYTRTYDGAKNSPNEFASIWVNDHGWYSHSDVRGKNHRLKLEEFKVEKGKSYLFRLINAGIALKHMFSIDKHKLVVVASDGEKIEPVEVTYLVMAPGERYDVIVKADQEEKVYFMRFDTMEVLKYDKSLQDASTKPMHFGLARLIYGSSESTANLDLNALQQSCASDKKCKVLNCVSGFFKSPLNYECVHLQSLQSLTDPTDKEQVLKDGFEASDNFKEFFFNLQYSNRINGKRFVYPRAPFYYFDGQDDSRILTKCDKCNNDGKEGCKCTWYLEIPLNSIVQMVFVNLMETENEEMDENGFADPIHIHGYHFYVIKQGWGTYDNGTTAAAGLLTEPNQDVKCENENKCKWKDDSSFKDGKMPDANLNKPIKKDTVIVPLGGYVVVRFKADNPGWWPIHSQNSLHHMSGMATVMKVGDKSEMARPPRPMPTCGHFTPMYDRGCNIVVANCMFVLTVVFGCMFFV